MVGEIIPVRVGLFDQPDLPIALPGLERFLPADRQQDIRVMFDEDQVRQSVFAAENRSGAAPMLIDARGEIGSDADIEDAAGE